jgi:hypothetical protein
MFVNGVFCKLGYLFSLVGWKRVGLQRGLAVPFVCFAIWVLFEPVCSGGASELPCETRRGWACEDGVR